MTTPSFNPFLLLGRWMLEGTDPRVRLAVQRALCDVFVMESPPGSNRGASIDEYNLEAGAQLGDPYCASAMTKWWRTAGLETPPQDPAWWQERGMPYLPPCSCDAWRIWGALTKRWSLEPEVGAAVLYGQPHDAQHIGIVIRTAPLVATFEANTSIDGQYEREGVAFDRKWLREQPRRVLGFVHPFPLSVPSPTPRGIV